VPTGNKGPKDDDDAPAKPLHTIGDRPIGHPFSRTCIHQADVLGFGKRLSYTKTFDRQMMRGLSWQRNACAGI
jgi:hypothetical protein